MFGYIPHPKQVVIPALLIFAGFAVIISDGWITFGTITIALSILTWVAILWCMGLEKYREYWQSIHDTIEILAKVDRPHLWSFFGLDAPPTEAKVTEVLPPNNEHGFIMKMNNLPVSQYEMRMIADKVLTGTPFSETSLSGIATNAKIRKLQKVFRDMEGLKANNRNSNNLGFSITHKGQQVLYSFASESVKELVRNGGASDRH